MSDDYQRIELITGAVRRRHWTTEQKLQIIEESFQPGETVSSVARRRGVAPNMLYRWRNRRVRAKIPKADVSGTRRTQHCGWQALSQIGCAAGRGFAWKGKRLCEGITSLAWMRSNSRNTVSRNRA